MGPAFSSKTKTVQTGGARSSNLSMLYQTKIYSQNKKSFDIFMKQIEALGKKTSYLTFNWSQIMQKALAAANYDELYSEYEAVLQENCRRDGSHEIVFYSMKIRAIFLTEIEVKYRLKESTLSIAQLKSLIFECKCYFMVISWCHKISSLGNTKAKDSEEVDKEVYMRFGQEEKVYRLLVEAAGKTYVEYLEREENSKILVEDFSCNQEVCNEEVVRQLKHIKKCKNFFQKEKSIILLQDALISNEDTEEASLEIILKVLGKSQIFAHLLIIKQLGSLDVKYLWNKIYGSTYDYLFH